MQRNTAATAKRKISLKIMVWNAARGGMRSVVEAYQRDGFLKQEDVRLVAAYVDGSVLKRQLILVKALCIYLYLLVTKKVELVHVHASMRGSFWRKGLFSSLARLFGIPVILHLHGSEMRPFYQSQSPFLQRLIRRHLERASAVIVLSESWRQFVGSIAPAAKITVVPNYVSVPPVSDSAARAEHDMLFLGMIGERKGVFDMIPAFAQIAGDFPDARLIIGGNGQIEAAEKLIAELNLQGRAVLAGWVVGDAKVELLRSSSIYILPSYNEGLPMSVLEAMAAGLAVITTTVGGIPELMTDGVDGVLIEPGDKAALANAMASLLRDRQLRLQLADAGRQRVKDHYSDGAVLPMLHDLYQATAK
jgi:glycosyltransferase involved in cell wall biosynthesis